MNTQERNAAHNALVMPKLVAEFNRLLSELVAKGYGERARLTRSWGREQETSIENNQYIWTPDLPYTLPRIHIGDLRIEVEVNYSYSGKLTGTFKHVKLEGGYCYGVKAVTLQTIDRENHGRCSTTLNPAKIVGSIDRWLIKLADARVESSQRLRREEEKAQLANDHYAAASKLREKFTGTGVEFTSSNWGISVSTKSLSPEKAARVAAALAAALKDEAAPRKCDCMRCLNGLDCSHGA